MDVRWTACGSESGFPFEINDRDCVGCTALFEAASSGHVALVQWLLSHGADPNIPENNGITPLMDAASGGDTAVMRVLLEHGARADLRDNFGDTALVYARQQKQYAALELLRHSDEPT